MELFPSQIEDKQENQTIEQAVKFGALLGEGGSFSFHFTQRNRERAHVGEWAIQQ